MYQQSGLWVGGMAGPYHTGYHHPGTLVPAVDAPNRTRPPSSTLKTVDSKEESLNQELSQVIMYRVGLVSVSWMADGLVGV